MRVLRTRHEEIEDSFVKALPKFEIKSQRDEIPRFFREQIKLIQSRFAYSLKANAFYGKEDQLPPLEICQFPTKFCRIYRIAKSYNSWEDALNEIGQKYSAYRSNKSLQERRAFGLPLRGCNLRRPSPLRIKIVRSSKEEEYYCFLIKIYAAFPRNSKIEKLSQFKIIDDFIKQLDDLEEIL